MLPFLQKQENNWVHNNEETFLCLTFHFSIESHFQLCSVTLFGSNSDVKRPKNVFCRLLIIWNSIKLSKQMIYSLQGEEPLPGPLHIC